MAIASMLRTAEEGFPNLVGKKVVIISYGSRGDVQPFVALGAHLESAGAQVLILTNVDHEAFVTSFGLKFVGTAGSCRDDHRRPEFVNGIATGNFGPFWAWNFKEKNKTMPEISMREGDASKDFAPDLIYATPLTYQNACRMSEQLKVPMILGSLFPTTNPFSSLGFRPFRPPAHPTLVHWTPSLTKPQFWQQGSHKVTGFLIIGDDGAGEALPDEVFGGPAERRRLEDFVSAGAPPVYMGWGSMVVPPSTAALAVRALKQAGLRGIILGGWAGLSAHMIEGGEDQQELEEYIADNVLFVQSAPHEWLFPRCAATVHHGGAGTVAAALRSGVPTIITPCGLDQPDNARIVEQSGCGLAMAQFSELTSADLSAALAVCTADDDMKAKCRAMAACLRAEDGLGGAVGEIDKYLRLKAEEPANEKRGPPPMFQHVARLLAGRRAAGSAAA
mmetsp:Transcript_113914/g.307684  ORF Transcript_113914/g.307684 Transcript_113914/m.307684 type:complete len:447 (+) Transcript_113914:119-1459(+)